MQTQKSEGSFSCKIVIYSYRFFKKMLYECTNNYQDRVTYFTHNNRFVKKKFGYPLLKNIKTLKIGCFKTIEADFRFRQKRTAEIEAGVLNCAPN